LEKAKGMLADAPCAEFQEMVDALEEGLAGANATLAPLLENLAMLQAKLPQAPEPVMPKFDPEKHPLLKKTLEKTEVAEPVVLNTGDMCEAYWREDRTWYKAKILSILGSASAPKYQVRYVDYDNTATLDRDGVRPLQQYKRKRDEPAPAPAAPVTSTPHVISGPASINPKAQAAKQEVAPEVPAQKKRKVPNQKALDKTVNNWKNWNSKGVGKKLSQKESMFRSGTSVDSRGGFSCGRLAERANLRSRLHRIRRGHDPDQQAHTSRQQGPC
jgi:survival-of-motor-neuron-related-splicing factor 30